VSRAGEELAADALSVTGYQSWGCNDYALEKMDPEDTGDTSTYLVLSPRDVIIVRPRDRKDHISWLVDRRRYEEALEELEHIEATEGVSGIDATDIGQRYIEHLASQGSSSPNFGTRTYCTLKTTSLRLLSYARKYAAKMSNAGKTGSLFSLRSNS